ncbi:MAG: crossover junction endodeoxyribonuclease RuvC [Candidatus Staskawiczbacteria bacterium]|jgi:crossover junction endodeoxyribonuclease RuvC
MIILGIDPGTATTGYGVINGCKGHRVCLIDYGCIITNPKFSTGERLQKIHIELGKLIKKYKPDIISVETLYFFKNLKTVMPVSQARGVILLAAAEKNIPVLDFTPLQMKMAITGYGRAEKKQVQKMIEILLCLEKKPKDKNKRKDDATDALGIAICAALKMKLDIT